MKNLIVRTLTGLLFAATLIGCIIYGPLSFVLLFAIITGVTLWEFSLNVNRHAGASVNMLINFVQDLAIRILTLLYLSPSLLPCFFFPSANCILKSQTLSKTGPMLLLHKCILPFHFHC